MRPLALAICLLAIGACGGGAASPALLTEDLATAVVEPAATAGGVSSEVEAIVAAACADSSYSRCIEKLTTMSDSLPGSLVAICEYAAGEGDVVLIESEDEAESVCSADGMYSPSAVGGIVQLP